MALVGEGIADFVGRRHLVGVLGLKMLGTVLLVELADGVDADANPHA